jgi:uncharacterized protein (TIRG00374 family)
MKQKIIYPLLKIAVVTAALFWLSRRVDFAGVWRVILGAKTQFLVLGALLSWLPIVISGFRWRILLGAIGIYVPAPRLSMICQIGQFFGVLVPGLAGDDGTRLLYISRIAPGRVGQACSTVLLDRFIGFSSLFVLSLVGIPCNWASLSAQAHTRVVAAGILLAGCLLLAGCALGFALSPARLAVLVGGVRARFPASKIVKELGDASEIFARSKVSLLTVAVEAILTQLLICATYWAVGIAVGIELPLLVWLSFVPVIVLAGVLPITFAGIGVRDYLLFLFLGDAVGGEGDRLAALSMLLLAYTLMSALFGGLLYLFYRAQPVVAPGGSPPEKEKFLQGVGLNP